MAAEPQPENAMLEPNSMPLQPASRRVFGRNITNILLPRDPTSKPQPMELGSNSSSSLVPADSDQEPTAHRPLQSCLSSENLPGRRASPDRIVQSAAIPPEAEYGDEIDAYLFAIEDAAPMRGSPLACQTEVTETMRAILTDWLVDVHVRFKLVPETLFLTVSIIDRYLSKCPVQRQKLQLVGVTAMLVACKYEEIYAPEVKDFAYITDNAYTKDEILTMEQQILSVLDFNLRFPSSYRFLQNFVRHLGCKQRTQYLAQYLIELSLVDCKMAKYKPSTIAAAALYFSNRMLNKDKCWNSRMAKWTRHTDFDLKVVVKEMMILMQLAEKSTMKAVRTKYSGLKFLEVSKISFKRKVALS